jgi:hypothetical protein
VFIGDYEYKCVTVWIYFVGCALESPCDLASRTRTFNGIQNLDVSSVSAVLSACHILQIPPMAVWVL